MIVPNKSLMIFLTFLITATSEIIRRELNQLNASETINCFYKKIISQFSS